MHQGRSARGMDCLGLLVCAARDIGIDVTDNLNYSRKPDHAEMRDGLLAHMRTVPHAAPGDVLWLWWQRNAYPTHLAVVSDTGTIIHVDSVGPKKVVEHTQPVTWQPRIVHRLRWQGW